MLFELALILPLYAIIFGLFFQLIPIIKIMTELNFFDEVDTPKVENQREFVKELITQGKKLPGKKPWTVELIDQASNEEVEELHSKYTQKDIEEDPIIKDSMADIGALMVSTFKKWLSPILIACHTANHTQGFMTTGYAQASAVEQEKNGKLSAYV